MLKNLTIKARLIAVLIFLSAQLVVGGIAGISSLNNANSTIKRIYDDRLVALGQLDQIIRLMNENDVTVARALTGEQENVDQTLKKVEERAKLIDKEWAAYMQSYLVEEEKKLAAAFNETRERYVTVGLKPAIEAMKVLDTQSAMAAVHGPMAQLMQDLRDRMDELIQLQLDVAKAEYERSQTAYQRLFYLSIIGVIVGVGLAIGIGYWVILSITRPLDVAIRVATAVAGRDLTQRIQPSSNDEAGRLMFALKNMNDSLVQIVSQVRAGADAIATASGQIATGNLDLSARTEQQAGALEETASSLEELTSTVKSSADNAVQANTLAQSAAQVANQGGQVVAQVVETMTAIDESSKKIANIIGVIDGIAFQTNILALNAAVEAARAGEQGRGFAVVAAEVRTLAQRSAAAAREIKDLINESLAKVCVGTEMVDRAGETMSQIVASIAQVTEIMGEITAAGREQSAGIEQINHAITDMDRVTQQNAALVEQSAAASKSMRDQAAALARAVSVFKLEAIPISAPADAAPSMVYGATKRLAVTRPRSLTQPGKT